MKRFAYALALIAGACGQNGDTTAMFGSGSSSVGKLLRAGKTEACAHPAVRAELMKQLEIDWTRVRPQDFHDFPVTDADVRQSAEDLGEPSLSEFQAIDTNPEVGEITCEVNLMLAPDRGSAPWRYVLRPVIEDEDDFVIKYELAMPDRTTMLAMKIYSDAMARARASAEEAANESSTEADLDDSDQSEIRTETDAPTTPSDTNSNE